LYTDFPGAQRGQPNPTVRCGGRQIDNQLNVRASHHVPDRNRPVNIKLGSPVLSARQVKVCTCPDIQDIPAGCVL
jgi:hypothetical protein